MTDVSPATQTKKKRHSRTTNKRFNLIIIQPVSFTIEYKQQLGDDGQEVVRVSDQFWGSLIAAMTANIK